MTEQTLIFNDKLDIATKKLMKEMINFTYDTCKEHNQLCVFELMLDSALLQTIGFMIDIVVSAKKDSYKEQLKADKR